MLRLNLFKSKLLCFIDPPVFIKELQPVTVKSGETAVFECQFLNAKAVDWYYDDMKIIDAEGTELTFQENGVSTLTIENVCVEDEGDYSVQGVNDEGAVSRTVRLQVAGQLWVVTGELPMDNFTL